VDALAEAGFCYAQGIGCRKNLKKSANFYRQAEAKGMSMVGNSWYVTLISPCLVVYRDPL
jgi:TPR repeat protein